MPKDNISYDHQMSEQEQQHYLADGLPLQDFMNREGTIPPNSAARAQLKRMGIPEATLALWVDISKQPDLQQAFSLLRGTEGEATYHWVYLNEDQKDRCYFILDVNISKPQQLQFHIPLLVADARWRDVLDIIYLMKTGMIIPITVYAGPAPDWRTMMQQQESDQVIEQLKKDSSGDITLTLTREAVHDMAQHYDAWRARFQPENTALLQQDTTLRFLIADVGDLTLHELAEGLIEIARQLQQLPDKEDSPLNKNTPLKRNKLRIDGLVQVKSQYRSSSSLRFAVVSSTDR